VVVQVVNFPFCNFYSLERYLRVSSHPYQELSGAESPSSSDIIMLPGVGTFQQGMDYLQETGLASIILNHVSAGGRLIGICLGMQMMLDRSNESPGVEGLGLIPGVCERIRAVPSFSVPHIGWNSLLLPEKSHSCIEQYSILSSLS
jgi:glutamine amidotransferase